MGNRSFQSYRQKEMVIDVDRGMLQNLGYAAGIVILDLIMPGIDGGKVFDVIHEFGPTMPLMRSMIKGTK